MHTPPPYIAYPLFQLWSIPSLSEWVNGWMGDCAILDMLFYLMISWMYTCCILGPWCVLHATRHQVYWGLAHVVFCWYSDLISHSHKHIKHNQGSVSTLTHPCKYIFTHLLCALSSCLDYTEWIITWYQKFSFHNVCSFQKLFTCKSHICWLDAIRLLSFCETQIILIDMK